jgi:hypothetical protein
VAHLVSARPVSAMRLPSRRRLEIRSRSFS